MTRNVFRPVLPGMLLCAALPLGLAGCFECDGVSKVWHVDADGDGYGVEEEYFNCDAPEGAVEGEVTGSVDCDDADRDVNPGVSDDEEAVCDGVDNDCDRQTDENFTGATMFPDADGDGFGDKFAEGTVVTTCDGSSGLVADATDCDDNNAEANPDGEDTVCSDGVDGDCDGQETCALEGDHGLDVLVTARGGWQVPGASVAVIAGTMQIAVGDPVHDQVLVVNAATGEEIATLSGTEGTEFGTAVAAGDFDGDGEVDLAMGAPGVDEAPGEVTIWKFSASWTKVNTIAPKTGFKGLGAILATLETGNGSDTADGLAVSVAYYNPGTDATEYCVYPITDSMVIDSVEDVDKICSLTVTGDWPLALSAAPNGLSIAVGYSGGVSSGSQVYGLPYTSGDSPDLVFSTTTTTSLLGASVALVDIDGGGKPDLLVGAPGAGAVYTLINPAASADTYGVSDADLTWTGESPTSFGAGIGLLGDLTGANDRTLAIGGDESLTLYRDAGTTVTATLTGFAGPVRTILNPGDVDGDGFDDLLVCDGTTVTLLFGGPLPPQDQGE